MAVIDAHLHVALIRRGNAPYAGVWALPGGFKGTGETLDAAAARELAEETGFVAPRLAQFGAYGDPGRDPRMDVVTVGYYAAVPEASPLRAGTDADDVRWAPVEDVIDGTVTLAFDHTHVIADARARLADDLDRTDAALALVHPEFTVPQLRRAYEAVWRLDVPAGLERETFALDRRNFRRQLESAPGPYIEPTGRTVPAPVRGGATPGRPAALHRATAAWADTAPVRRPRALRELPRNGRQAP